MAEPGSLALHPLLYVAWADGERAAILRIEEALGLGGPDAVATLPDPARPIAPLPDIRPRFDPGTMARFLGGPAPEIRQRVSALLSDGRFETVAGLPTADYLTRVTGWCRVLADEGLGALSFPAEFGAGTTPRPSSPPSRRSPSSTSSCSRSSACSSGSSAAASTSSGRGDTTRHT